MEHENTELKIHFTVKFTFITTNGTKNEFYGKVQNIPDTAVFLGTSKGQLWPAFLSKTYIYLF